MSKYLLLVSGYTDNPDIPDFEHKEDFDDDKAAFSRMMEMYRDVTINGGSNNIAHSDFGKHWATVEFNDGSKTTWEILEEV